MNIDQGIKQFNGDERQYKTSLITFDSLTLYPSINNIVEFYQNKDLKSIYLELKYDKINYISSIDIPISSNSQSNSIWNHSFPIHQEPNYDYQLHNQLRNYFLKVKETRQIISQYAGIQLDCTQIDFILQQMLLGQNLNNTLTQPKSNRSNENPTNLYDEKDQYLQTKDNGISRPRKPNEDCCYIY